MHRRRKYYKVSDANQEKNPPHPVLSQSNLPLIHLSIIDT